MTNNEWPDTILEADTVSKLIDALKVGSIDMIDFPELCHQNKNDEDEQERANRISPEELDRFDKICSKIIHVEKGTVVLTRFLKINILNAVRTKRFNLLRDFPELAKARANAFMSMDWSNITDQERSWFLGICRIINA